MRTSTIIRALAGVLSTILLGILLVVGSPSLGSVQASTPVPADRVCNVGVKIPFEAVIGPKETVVSATLIDPAGCVRHARWDLYETTFHKKMDATLDFFPGQNTVTITVEEPGTYQLVSDDAYNEDKNAQVTGLTPTFRDSNVLTARLASKVSLSVKHKHGHKYLVASARYWEPVGSSWSELIDMPLKFQRSVEGHWVKVGSAESGKRLRVHGAGPWRVKVPETPFIWGTVASHK